jgi:RNA polymerase sigma-70 factor (ECF subfamily)
MSGKDGYLALFVKHNHHLFNFVLTLVPNYSDAEDILQESAQTMWKKFDTFEEGTNFLAWACQIIRFKVSNYYRTVKQDYKLDDGIIEKLSIVYHEREKHAIERKAALTGCMSQLPQADLKLIKLRFYQNITVQEIARRSNRSVNTLYKRISTIYVLLQSCIQRTLIEWGVDK